MRSRKVQEPKLKCHRRRVEAGALSALRVPRGFVPAMLAWFSNHARDLPWRRTRDAYAIWVSEIMLQQTQVKTVLPFYERWMSALPTVQSLAGARSATIHKLWEGLGYYTRVRNMQKAAHVILEKHGGSFPTEFDEVLALPGVGRYTAGAICSIAFNQPVPILDGNVIRVFARVIGLRENARAKQTNERLWRLAEALVAEAGRTPGRGLRILRQRWVTGSCSALNQSLMELGATVCTPRQPRCQVCPVARFCAARRDGIADRLPNLGTRVAATARRFATAVIVHNDSVLVRQRPAGAVNAHLWEFPNIETGLSATVSEMRVALETELGWRPEEWHAFGTIKHTITRYRIALDVFGGALGGDTKAARSGQWISTKDLPYLAFTSAHRKAWERVSARWSQVDGPFVSPAFR